VIAIDGFNEVTVRIIYTNGADSDDWQVIPEHRVTKYDLPLSNTATSGLRPIHI
jgi:hypothetical protein